MTDLRKLARGQDCQVRIPGICNFNPETVVLAHFRMPGTCGVGMKPHDYQAAICCSACHDALDQRTPTHYAKSELDLMMCHGILRTHECWRRMGVMK